MTEKPESTDAIVVRDEELELASSPLAGPPADGVTALAQMPEDEFEQKLANMKAGQERIARVKRELMTEDVHFGTIPGTKKPSLLKPGAEVLCQIYGLRASFVPRLTYGDGESSPMVSAIVECRLHLGDIGGPIIAIGFGSANTWERKHRYRRGQRTCPDCGVVGAVIRGKAEFGGGWLCWKNIDGCGAKFDIADPAITGQAVGDVENEDQLDLENTVLKMGEKRAYIDATLRGTASSDLFTQDIGDNGKDKGKGKSGRGKVGSDQAPMQQPSSREKADGNHTPTPGEGKEISELLEVQSMFVDGDSITTSQQGRLFNLAQKNGWTNAGVTDEIMRVLAIGVEEIPKLGDAYASIVSWFQRNSPAS
jgi:hypothetical protein